jgi:hypothetical protein
MVRWLGIVLGTLRSAVHTHRELALENLALRQQLAVCKARQPRPRLTEIDRIFWVLLSRLWTSWRHSLLVVRPQTVVGTGRDFDAIGRVRVGDDPVGPRSVRTSDT